MNPMTVTPLPSALTDDTPLRLDRAAALAFPQGGMSASGLRRERDRGNLVTEIVAGKEFTTLAAIRAMREKCRAQPKPHASHGAQRAAVRTASSATPASGSSATQAASSALDAALMTVQALKRRSRLG